MRPAQQFVGAGISYRKPYRRELLAEDGLSKPAVLEVVPSHFFAEPDLLAPLAERYPLVFHEVGCSIGTAEPVDTELLRRIKALFAYGKPLFFTEHLALTTSPAGIDLGHLAPIWYTRSALDSLSERVLRWQEVLGVEVALETITVPFVVPEADFTECEFFHELVTQTGCGLLLDVTNQVINGHNLGFDPEAVLAGYPLHAVMQVHLAGGQRGPDRWVDSHDAPVDAESFAVLKMLRGRAPLRTIIVERDDNLLPLADLMGEVSRAGAVWSGSE